ncbi:hypothetical protein C8R44DRAFT_885641 [Mycena epipterygia]|nr:hypothetical protein C8R44DRAFT_885641 [Mycena epipterygia]
MRASSRRPCSVRRGGVLRHLSTTSRESIIHLRRNRLQATRWQSRYVAGLAQFLSRGLPFPLLGWAYPARICTLCADRAARDAVLLSFLPLSRLPSLPRHVGAYALLSLSFFTLSLQPTSARKTTATGHRRDLSSALRVRQVARMRCVPFAPRTTSFPCLPSHQYLSLALPRRCPCLCPSPHSPPLSYLVPSLPPSLVTSIPSLPRSSAVSCRSDELHAAASSSIATSERFDDCSRVEVGTGGRMGDPCSDGDAQMQEQDGERAARPRRAYAQWSEPRKKCRAMSELRAPNYIRTPQRPARKRNTQPEEYQYQKRQYHLAQRGQRRRHAMSMTEVPPCPPARVKNPRRSARCTVYPPAPVTPVFSVPHNPARLALLRAPSGPAS